MLTTGPAQALDRCSVGQRVVKPGGKQGVVTAVQGTGCTVRADGEPFTSTYAAFMLDPVPGAAPANKAPAAKLPAAKAPTARTVPASQPSTGVAAATVRTGTYQCVSTSAGNLVLRILAGNRYGNAQGSTGRYTTEASGRMTFVGGPWDGFYGKGLAAGRFGLTADPRANFFDMTCDRRGD